MYGKIFEMMYDGTLADNWEAMITFQQMIVLCDKNGIVDMTSQAISRRTGIPLEHIKVGIKILESDDPLSRTPGSEGKRIERIDAHRDWGWSIVNHSMYTQMLSRAEKQDADKVRMRNKRRQEAMSQSVASSRSESQSVADVAHVDVDVDVNENVPKESKPKKRRKPFVPPTYDELVEYVLEKGGTAEVAKKAFDHYDASDWVKSNGQKVLNWKQTLLTNWINQNDRSQQSTHPKSESPIERVFNDSAKVLRSAYGDNSK